MTTKHMMDALFAAPNGAPFKIAQVSLPEPSAGQVLVRIHASGVNPLDLKIRAGEASHAKHPLPAVLGMDLAGVVEAIGPGVIEFQTGDEVFGMTGGVGGVPGTLAQYAAVDVRLLAAKPASLTMRQAAALPLIFITAWEGLMDRAATRAGHKVLVHGGAGGVGHVAIQIARAQGAKVFATGSARSLAFIHALGATAIDRGTTSVADYVAQYTNGHGFDVIYDTAGGASLDASFSAVCRFGHVVSALGWGMHALAPLSFRAASYSGVFTLLPLLTGEGRAHHGDILRQATALVQAGKLQPRVDPRRFTLETVEAAYEAVGEGGSAGKIVIDVLPR